MGTGLARARGFACAIAYGCGDDDDSAPGNSAGTGGSQAGEAGAAAGEHSCPAPCPSGGTSGGHAGMTGNGGSLTEAGQAGSNTSMAGALQGGAAGSENTAIGGAGASAGGVGGDAGAGGGPSAKEVQKICADYAAFYKKVAQATTCVDVSAGVNSSCLQGYATNTCVDEAAAYFGCAKDRPDSDFQCVAGTVSAKAGICTAEQAGYIACVNQ